MAGPETRCPRCGHSPIPEDEEACPRCGLAFFDRPQETTYATATRAGALTGSVTANPTPVAVALAAGAVMWVCRGFGFPVSLGDPLWVLGLAVLAVAGAALVMSNVGPAKHAAIVVGLGELAAAAVLGATGHAGAVLPIALHAVVLWAMTAFEPGPWRLAFGAGFAIVAALSTGAFMVHQSTPTKAPTIAVISAAEAGVTLTLPDGWHEASPLQVAPHFSIPDSGVLGYAFATDAPKRVGLLEISRAPLSKSMELACVGHLDAAGLPLAQRIEGSPPAEFGVHGRLYELAPPGTLGRFACGKRGDFYVSLVVLSEGNDGPAAFEEVARGFHVVQ